MIWIITDFVLVSLLMMSAAEVFGCVFGVGNRTPFVLVCAGGMLLVAFMISKDAFGFTRVADLLIPAVNLAFAAVFLPFLLAFLLKNFL